MKDAPMTVIETQSFLWTAKALVSDEERMDLIAYLAENPTAGDIMEGTGGVRKVRWARRGGGKSGGFRVIYYYYSEVIPLFALAMFEKSAKVNLSAAEKNEMKKLTAILSQYGRNK